MIYKRNNTMSKSRYLPMSLVSNNLYSCRKCRSIVAHRGRIESRLVEKIFSAWGSSYPGVFPLRDSSIGKGDWREDEKKYENRQFNDSEL